MQKLEEVIVHWFVIEKNVFQSFEIWLHAFGNNVSK